MPSEKQMAEIAKGEENPGELLKETLRKPRTKVEREFEYSIYIRRNNDSTGGVGLGARTMAEMMTKVFYNACFFMSQTGAFVEVTEVCKRCGGKGDIPRGVRRRPAKCPMCKGVDSSRIIIETVVKPSRECRLFRYEDMVFNGALVPL